MPGLPNNLFRNGTILDGTGGDAFNADLLTHGYFAEIVVFRPEAIDSPATYEAPALPPQGVCEVYDNGAPAMQGLRAIA